MGKKKAKQSGSKASSVVKRKEGPGWVSKKKIAKAAAANRNKNADNNNQEKTCHLLRCAEGALHTGSVAVRRVPVDHPDETDSIPVGGGGVQTSKKGKKPKKKKKKQRTAVVTCSDLPPPPPPPPPLPAAPSLPDTPTPAPTPPPRIIAHAVHVQPLLVLDLNGILCRRIRYDRLSPSEQKQQQQAGEAGRGLRFRPAVGHVAGTPVVARTDVTELLRYLDANFTLAVWTSAKQRTARALVGMLFPEEIANRLLFVWGQNRCDATKLDTEKGDDADANKQQGIESDMQDVADVDAMDAVNDVNANADANNNNNNNDKEYNVVFIKSLSKVWSAYPLWDESTTLLIDDSPEKVPDRYSRNTVHPPPIHGRLMMDGPSPGVGDGEGAHDGGISNGAPPSDEANQEEQGVFFRSLADFWRAGISRGQSQAAADGSSSGNVCSSSEDAKEDDVRNTNELFAFLEKFGCGHMGWRGAGAVTTSTTDQQTT